MYAELLFVIATVLVVGGAVASTILIAVQMNRMHRDYMHEIRTLHLFIQSRTSTEYADAVGRMTAPTLRPRRVETPEMMIERNFGGVPG